MRFTKIKKAVAMLLLFALIFSTFPVSAVANDTDDPEETAATEETATVETETGLPPEEAEASPTATGQETAEAETNEQAVKAEVENETVSGQEEAAFFTEAQDTEETSSFAEDVNETAIPFSTLMGSIAPSEVRVISDSTPPLKENIFSEKDAAILSRAAYDGYLFRSQVVGGNGNNGYLFYPKNNASPVTFTYTLGGTTYNTTLGENFVVLHYINQTNTTPTSVFDAPVVYCLEPNMGTSNNQGYSQHDQSNSQLLSSLLSADQINAVKLVCAYGWPFGFPDAYNDYSADIKAFNQQCATQIIIWEIVMGLRSPTGTFQVNDNRLYQIFNGRPTYVTPYGDNSEFIAAYNEISERLSRHNAYPSFAAGTAASAPRNKMTYNTATGLYTATLIDESAKEVLVNDFANNNFNAPSGVTVTRNGNVLTVTATEAAMANGDITVSMTGRKLSADPIYVWECIWSSGNGHDQTLISIPYASEAKAYFKLYSETKTVRLQKSYNGSDSASVRACIEGNPLYTLAGAVYEIHQGSATGPVTEILTTDANGNATGNVKYNVDTVLYAVEIKAPPGYLKNSTPTKLTVKGDSNLNVFKVKDDPTFDPAKLEVKKTGTAGTFIPGTVFKVDYYTSYWCDNGDANRPSQLKRTWYLKSDANGVVRFDDAHRLTGDDYPSDEFYKPYGAITFPLGCIYVQEIKAADGYITPTGSDAGVCIFIKQGDIDDGVFQSDDGVPAVAYWGDGYANPITTQNPKGIYKMENDSDGTVITAENTEKGTMTMKKTLPADTPGGVEGYFFNIYRRPNTSAGETDGELWYGRTDESGNIYETKASHAAVSPDKRNYTFTGLVDGNYNFREVLSARSFKNTKTTKIRITTSGGTTASVDLTFQGNALNWESNGDCTIGGANGIHITGLNGGGTLHIEITNAPIYGTPPIVRKVDPSEASLENAIFKVEYFASTSVTGTALHTWYFKTDADGYFTLDAAHRVNSSEYPSDSTLYLLTAFPIGMLRIQEVKAPDGFILSNTIAYWSMRRASDTSFTVNSYWSDVNGNAVTSFGTNNDFYVPSENSSGEGYERNMPIPGTMTMAKTLPADTPGGLEGYCFNIYRHEGQGLSSKLWKGRSDDNGNIYQSNDYSAKPEGNRNYTFTGLYDGYYSIRELLSLRDFKNTKTTKIRITTSGGTTAPVDLTFQGNTLNWETNGDCTIGGSNGIHITGLNGGGTLRIEIENTPIYGAPPTIIKKDATTSDDLEGAIFQVEYLVGESTTDATLERTWYLRSKADGTVKLEADYIVDTNDYPSYQSDALYEAGKLPIGILRVREIEAPPGFAPTNAIGLWYMKLTNPKTFTVSNYWGDLQGNETDEYSDYVYVIDNDLYVENMPSNTLTIRKTSTTNGKIKGITFEVKQKVNGTWVPLGDGTYVTGEGGILQIPEIRAGMFLEIKEIVEDGTICLSENPQYITTQVGDNPVYFENADISLKIKKECSDGKISGITFKVEKKVEGRWQLVGSGTYTTGTDGIIPIATEHLAIGAEFRITETAPQNYVCVNTPDGVQTVTLHKGENVVTFVNKPVIKLELYKTSDDGNIKDIEFKLYKRNNAGIFEYVGTYLTDENGYICDEEVLKEGETYKIVETVPTDSFCEKPVKTFTAHLGTNTVRFENFGIVTLEIIKHTSSADGIVDGFKFKIERLVPQTGSGITVRERWEQIGTYVSANGGHIYIDEPGLLRIGDEIKIEEIDLGDYVCTTENPIRRTLVKGKNVFEFTNRFDTELLIQKESDDGKIKDITFVVERKKAEGEYSPLGEFKTDENGQIHIEDIIEKDQTYRITETLPYGYETDHISQEITIRGGTNKVTFVNRLIECSIKIAKVYEGTRVPLKDAGFKLYDERGEELAEGFTNENGELKFERLRVGNYTLKEFQAPPGFELDETEIPITLTPDERDITITRENRIIPGLIRVYKEDDKGRAMKGVTYLLEYSLDDTDTWLPIQVRDADSPVQCGYSTSANIVDGCITTGDDGIAEFAGLAIDNAMHTIKYRLTEVGTQDGYDLLPEPVFEGHLTEEQVELAYKVVDHHVFEMPMTGGNGFTLAAIGSALAVLLAVIILLQKKHKV